MSYDTRWRWKSVSTFFASCPIERRTRVLLSCLIVVLACLRFAHIHLLWADEDYHLAASIFILKGKIPYRDFWYDKPPLSAIFYLIIGGYPGWPLRILDAAYILGVCALMWRLAQVWWGEAEAWTAALLLSFYTAFYLPSAIIPFAPDALMMAPQVAALYFAFRKRAFCAGVWTGVAFFVNTKAVFVLAVCAIWLFSQWLELAAGFALVVIAGSGCLAGVPRTGLALGLDLCENVSRATSLCDRAEAYGGLGGLSCGSHSGGNLCLVSVEPEGALASRRLAGAFLCRRMYRAALCTSLLLAVSATARDDCFAGHGGRVAPVPETSPCGADCLIAGAVYSLWPALCPSGARQHGAPRAALDGRDPRFRQPKGSANRLRSEAARVHAVCLGLPAGPLCIHAHDRTGPVLGLSAAHRSTSGSPSARNYGGLWRAGSTKPQAADPFEPNFPRRRAGAVESPACAYGLSRAEAVAGAIPLGCKNESVTD